MRTWVDNTGLHVVGRALEGTPAYPSDIDIKGFLQFLTLLVFSDSLLINDFQCDSVRERTVYIQSKLRSLGVDNETIQIVPMNQSEYENACANSANIFAAYLIGVPPVTRSHTEDKLLQAARPDVPEKELLNIRSTHNAITVGLTESQRTEMKEQAFITRASGAVDYMLCVSEDLWSSVQVAKEAKQKAGFRWTGNDTELLNALLRVFLNTVLANEKGAEYTPAVARAELFRTNPHRLLSELSARVGKKEGMSGTLGLAIPQVSYALLVRSGGNPHLMIEEALKLRAKGKELRAWLDRTLSKLLKPVSTRTSTAEEHSIIQDFRIEAKQLSEALEVDLNIRSRDSTGRFIDALELLFSRRWLSSPKDTSKFVKWWGNRERVILLTDASRALGRDDIEHHAFENLKRSICKRGQ